jgi:mRNA interferase HigB
MRIISKKPVRDFWEKHPEARLALEEWFKKANHCQAASFPMLLNTFGSADYVDGFTIFDVGGNKYRIAAVVHYDKQRIYIREVMTHTEYDRNHWRKK